MARKLYGVFSDKFGLTYSKKTASDYVKKHGGEVRFINDAPEYHSFDAHTFHAISRPLGGEVKKNPKKKKPVKPFDGNFGTGYIGNPVSESTLKVGDEVLNPNKEGVYIVRGWNYHNVTLENLHTGKKKLVAWYTFKKTYVKVYGDNPLHGNPKKKKGKKRGVNLNAIIGAIKSPKTPKHLKEGLKRKYGHLLK